MVSTVKVFNVTIPSKDGLCCMICKIMNSENNPLISNYCRNKLKCGQFLRETPQAMAAPITNRKLLELGKSLYVIVAKDFMENYTFRDHCDALNIQMTDLLDPFPIYVYKMCLLYTMEYRLAPQWNKVGLYLVEGQDFLSSTGSVSAITLNIKKIRDNNAQFHVEALNLKIPFLRLNTVRPLQHGSQPVRVLPSLKVATVLSISKEIKEKHLFKNYEEMRIYWKNMHGYILPDYKEGLLFYKIAFFYFKSNVYVYPEMCLTSGPLEILPPTMDPVSRIYKFAGDLRGRVTKLCGQELDICPENTYQAAVLACTPMLPKIDRFSTCDTGYGTRSKRSSNEMLLSQTFNSCDIPIKRSRLSLSGINDSLTCKTKVDNFDFGIGPARSTSNFDKLLKTVGNITVLCDADSAMASKPIVQKNEEKSHYFKQEEPKSENKALVELMDKKEKTEKQNLKEKLLRNF